MTTNVLRAPQVIGSGARRTLYIAIGLIVLALVVAALVSGDDSSTTSSAAAGTGGPNEAGVASAVAVAGRAVFPAHPDEAAVAASVSRSSDEAVPPGSGVPFGRSPRPAYEPNLLPK